MEGRDCRFVLVMDRYNDHWHLDIVPAYYTKEMIKSMIFCVAVHFLNCSHVSKIHFQTAAQFLATAAKVL